MNFVEELRWRGMIHSMMPGTEELLAKEKVTAYVGIDPTADSLHIGHLCGVMMLRHLQRCGHKPLALIGGATGMIGDPSGKSQERNLLNEETLTHNVACIKKQLAHFLDFDSDSPNKAELVNNYDWMKNYSFLDFSRDIGKCITVNYMMAKDSVKRRLNGEFQEGMSFTEFTYQLLQGYDYLHLYQTKNCKLQMGGSDQWGNITTGAELIRRKLGNEHQAYALVCPLITKSDGKKFGKTEKGNIWLDRKRTSPYTFYQFWLNVADDDAEKYIKIFTSIDKETIEALIEEHRQDPGRRILQKRLAEEITIMVHSREDYELAVEASNILFGKATKDSLVKLDEQTLLDVFSGVPQYELNKNDIIGIKAVDLLAEKTDCFPSKGEMRKMVKGGGVSINKEKLNDPEIVISENDLVDGKYIEAKKDLNLKFRGSSNQRIIMVKESLEKGEIVLWQ